MTDSELRRLMESSPQTGQRALYDEYCGYVYAITANCLRSCGSAEDVEECVSDTFVAVFRALRDPSGHNGDLKGIISTIARRTAIDSFRKLSVRNSRSAAFDDLEYELSSGEDIENDSERSETQRILLGCVEKLGQPDSDIILQHYFYGRSSGQIASFLKMTESAVQKRLQRARKKLRSLLEKAGIDGV
jgi:RNA polymerase sigma-70 factor (ECF subfamily)